MRLYEYGYLIAALEAQQGGMTDQWRELPLCYTREHPEIYNAYSKSLNHEQILKTIRKAALDAARDRKRRKENEQE